MPAVRKRKRSHFQSNTDIPAVQDDVVTRVEVTRSTSRRIHTTTTKVSIPVTDAPSSSTPEAPFPACELTFNNLCIPTPKQARTRKAPSNSITVSNLPFYLFFRYAIADHYYHRMVLSSGFSTKRSSLTNSWRTKVLVPILPFLLGGVGGENTRFV